MLGSVVDCQPLGSAAPGGAGAAFGATVPRRSVCCQSSNILRARRRGGTCWARSESMGMPLSCTFWTWRTSGLAGKRKDIIIYSTPVFEIIYQLRPHIFGQENHYLYLSRILTAQPIMSCISCRSQSTAWGSSFNTALRSSTAQASGSLAVGCSLRIVS